MNSLQGYRALVCGASKGIGRASAEQLATMGANVTLLARSAEELERVRTGLAVAQGQQHSVIVADVGEADDLFHSVHKHVKNNGAFHIVVNNTAGPLGGQLTEAISDQLMQTFHNHLLIAHGLMQIVLPGMKEKGFGRLINIISTSVKQPIEGLGVSNTIRGAMASWSKTLATEVAPYGVTVNNILPGATETERLQQIITRKATITGMSEDAIRHDMAREIPVGRFAKPEEIAYAVGFLASPLAAYITGTSILIDGGRTKTIS